MKPLDIVLTHSTPDLSRQLHLLLLYQKLKDGKIFEEKLFIITI
jgi:hypothetical protein